MIPDYRSDIPRALAVAAHSGTSFVPEKRAESVLNEYQGTLEEAYKKMSAAAAKGGTTDMLEDEFQRFRAGFASRYRHYQQTRSRIMSTMITGGSNFPVRQMNKRNEISHRRLTELIDFEARAVRAALRNLRPDLRPIMSGDADAIERLSAEISKAKMEQARMKETNAVVRKNKKRPLEEQEAELVKIGYSPALAAELLKPDFAGRDGFPGYQLTNNLANIKRMEDRLKIIEAKHAMPAGEEEIGDIRVESAPAENRIRVYFPGKPDAGTRDKLKAEGFRWAPSQGAWSGYHNSRRLNAAYEIAKSLVPA